MAGSDPSIFDLLIPPVRQWKLVVGLAFGAGLVGAAISLVLPAQYTASTTFIPAAAGGGSSLPQGLAGLATQFGLNLSTPTSFSPDFFAEVLTSRELLRGTLLSQFEDPRGGTTTKTLIDILEIKGRTDDDRMSNGIRELEERVSQRVDRRTGIVTLSVTGKPPALTAAVANRMVELLNTFNLERLRSQSRERRRFVGERLQDAERELRDAEDQQLKFLQANRRYADSPLLSFEANRRSREVQLRQEVFQTLTREFEEARIAEVRDTPLLTIIDAAAPPDRRSSPRRKFIVFLAMVVAMLTGLGLAYFAEFRREAQLEGDTKYARFVRAWSDAKAELRAGLRMSSGRR